MFGEEIAEWLRLGNWAQQVVTLRAAALLLERTGRHAASLTLLLSLDAATPDTAWGSDASDAGAASKAARRSLSRSEGAAIETRAQQLDRAGLVAYALAELHGLHNETSMEGHL
ncbi:MAG TPA: hypothetical protein VFX15_06135 [Actinomycetes bacterium]|nr:hypothetical protein [Actinomycetes bacterium]